MLNSQNKSTVLKDIRYLSFNWLMRFLNHFSLMFKKNKNNFAVI